MTTSPAKFETGKTYSTRSTCDSGCVFSFTVVKRTAKTITIKSVFGTERRGVKADPYYNGVESCFPRGQHSMAPIITALDAG